MVAPGPRVAPPGWARPSDLRGLRAFAAYQAPLAWVWELERAGYLRGWGFTVRTGCLGDLDGRDVMLCIVCARRFVCRLDCSLVVLF